MGVNNAGGSIGARLPVPWAEGGLLPGPLELDEHLFFDLGACSNVNVCGVEFL